MPAALTRGGGAGIARAVAPGSAITPYDEREVLAFTDDALEAYEAAGRQPDQSAVVWLSRMQFDAGQIGYPAARARHLAALKAALGLKSAAQAVRKQPVAARLVARRVFFGLETGEKWTAIECSDFALLSRFLRGEDIAPVLNQRAECGFNLLRVWTLFDIERIGTLTAVNYDRIPEFVRLCARHGLYVELTGYTGINDPEHWSKLCAASLACRPLPLLELVNELDANTNEPDSHGRVFELARHRQAPSPLLSSHGSNGSQRVAVRPAWSYEVFHTNDAHEWHRKTGHNAMELAEGAGDGGVAPSHVPVLTNENTRFADRCQSAAMAFDAAAGAALLCAGSCYHSTAGKLGAPWEHVELECARAWAAGAKSVPLEFQDGRYVHAQRLETATDLRVYQRVLPDGRAHTVRIRK
jgi:hypothetical protein